MKKKAYTSETLKKPFRCNLSILIGFIFSALLVSLGLIVTLYSYETQKKATLEATEIIFELSSIHTEEKLSGLINSVKSFVSMSSVLNSLGAGEVEKMSVLLPYFNQSFITIPWMESIYVGYGDGSFYMVQSIRDKEQIRQATSAPDLAAYSMKMIPPASDKNRKVQFSYFDSELTLLGTREDDFRGFDPREREWYKKSISNNDIVITEPYLFFTTRKVGVTVARSLLQGAGVVGADSALSDLGVLLQEQKITQSTQIVLLDVKGRVILSADEADLMKLQELRASVHGGSLHVKDLDNKAINALYKKSIATQFAGGHVVEVDGGKWFGHIRQVADDTGKGFYIATVAPFDELMKNIQATRKRNFLIILLVVIAALAIGIYFSRRIAEPLRALVTQAENVRNFKLDAPLSIQSRICEVDQLASSMTVMQQAINRFVEIARALSAEKQMDKVLEMIVKEAQSVTGADGGGIGLVSDDGKSFSYVLVRNTKSAVYYGEGKIPIDTITLGDKTGKQTLEASVIKNAQTKVVDDVGGSLSGVALPILRLHEKAEYCCDSLLIIPLLNRQDEVIGLLHLVNARDESSGAIIGFSEDKTAYVKALASNAALALDNNRLIRAQKDLFDSFVRLIAGAIDTKSPYTGGHCQRVPVIAGMLAKAASSATHGHFGNFELSEDERYELYVASWLHDCGKVTTPEYIVDKATKLETIYNRIHEVRTRFEVLWRDTDIVFYKGLLENPDQEFQLKEKRDTRRHELQDDFSYIAECNLGGEFMEPDKAVRLGKISRQTWQRNFDNRLGLSSDEEARTNMDLHVSLPVAETLLADKPEHIFPRLDDGNPYGDNPCNITMEVPDHRYNQGELYNLSVAKGTLTEEERYKINDHVVQTIEMLHTLPFPKEIRRVPDWAGNHHEKLDGSGYPRSLTADQLSIPERIMAVADIFEALTAADRPYKTPKKLSSCLKIMSFMRNDGHICPDLFELLVTSGLYLEYARKYMQDEQIDDVIIEDYL
jgi:HD-GYP domain-containing protein (c-di-GMP phosphodiesterase class II)/HAMP domain-containing protein